jgi:hypothetical protein
MRSIKLSGREATVVRAIGFCDAALGADLQDLTRMELDDIASTINSLISAGFVESIPYSETVDLAELPVTSFEVNPAFARELKEALRRR